MKPTTDPTAIGLNRTGAGTSPRDADELAEGARAAVPQPSYDVTPIEEVRRSYSDEAEPVGTLPPPLTGKGVVTTVKEALKGEKPTVLLDLLGERLAFERTGTRLYEAALAKFEVADVHPGGPSRQALEEIRDEELAHAALVAEAITTLGGDPTAMTPSADVMAVASEGLVKVLTDARTTLTEALKALTVAELSDNDGWSTLIDIAEKMEQHDMAERFRDARAAESRHLALVHQWLHKAIEGQAGVAGEAGAAAPPPAE